MITGKIYRAKEGCVDESFCVILEWKRVIGHLWNSPLAHMHRAEKDNMEVLPFRDLPGTMNPVVSVFDRCRDWASEAEQPVMGI